MPQEFNPKVSIVIPVYNGSNYLREAIDSALSQTYKNTEVIVVNDGSADGGKTDEICKSYGKKIRYFKKENGGVASALNFGIEKMDGEYFSWLSHDDVYYPDKVEKQVAYLRKSVNKNIILYSDVQYIDEMGQTLSHSNYGVEYSAKQLNARYFSTFKGFMNGCALLIPQKCFDETGLFNENLETTNDYDMWFRFSKRYDIRFVPEILIKYRLHKEQGTLTNSRYLKESEKLWSSAIEGITEKEILQFEKDLFKFYYELSIQMHNSGYLKSQKVALNIAEKYYDKEHPKLSVIMPCYNSSKFLDEAVQSILNQTYGNFEFIIVDDSSSDNSWEVLEKYNEKDFRIILVKNKYKKGISGAMNTGLDLCNGEFITRMDSDDVSISSRFEKQIAFLEKNSRYGLCSVNIELFGEKTLSCVYKKTDVPLEWLFFWRNPIANAPIMYRSSIIKDNNLSFEEYATAEDYNFLCKVILHTRPYYIDEVLYKYRIHERSVFQKNKELSIVNSLESSKALIKKISGQEIPAFYDELTDFKEIKLHNTDVDTGKMFDWIDGLLNSARRYWKWSETEFLYAKDESRRRVYRFLCYDEIIVLMKEIEVLQTNHNKDMEAIMKLQIENQELLKENQRKIYKLLLPLKKLCDGIYSLKIWIAKSIRDINFKQGK